LAVFDTYQAPFLKRGVNVLNIGDAPYVALGGAGTPHAEKTAADDGAADEVIGKRTPGSGSEACRQ